MDLIPPVYAAPLDGACRALAENAASSEVPAILWRF